MPSHCLPKAAALPTNSSPSLTYLASMASLAWPVWPLIFTVETPACTALVAEPARRFTLGDPARALDAEQGGAGDFRATGV
jgi:hypothetical protein